MIKIGISSCLLGNPVRYDGGHRLDPYITGTLGRYFDWVPVCPEVECGLTVPREAMRLLGDPASPRLVTWFTGEDHTDRMLGWVGSALDELEGEDLNGFIFKARSPSSGIRGVRMYPRGGGSPRKGPGLFGGAFVARFPLVPAIDEEDLHDPALRDNFISRIFVHIRWTEFINGGFTPGGLVEFHARHKLVVMAHSPRHYSLLGRLVAEGKETGERKLREEYSSLLFEALALVATQKKHRNVLQHAAGYFKRNAGSEERQEISDAIEEFSHGRLPLIVPVTLLTHYARKYDEQYLLNQWYLNPHPVELMLRYHA